MTHNEELSDFLRARRAALTPEAAGLPSGPARRVPGLRREELAALAGVSVDYYTRLEQGRHITPSEPVLDAIAAALSLDPAETAYLHAVARGKPQARRRSPRPQVVHPGTLRLIDQLGDVPAYVLGRRTDVLATNRMARLLLADFDAMPARQRNAARWLVLDEGARSLWGDAWEKTASAMTGALRMDAARYPDDPRTTELVGELSMHSEHFRRWWADHLVTEQGHDAKTLYHPIIGRIELASEALSLPDPGQTLFVYLAKPGSEAEDALALLAHGIQAEHPAPRPVK
ncbi:helix-turn-helix domain-containing protein [Actinoplanes sp. LDG1-06]|uniref:Helix-turn-helix domain-containing protein n=1 Tax=Paractinoplanes ovalisporus TaxID=2810368 RepID=A0ABS2AFQ2_9ACTN|nr:helix-turn-helix transcriptional regulator [Actinoplanes ovalisporus]MBM2618605.1 helix-turn-helix domain-containing protein [Actinoplanes ovalisporus]